MDEKKPLTTREDFRVFAVIAIPIFLVTFLIIGLIVVLGTRS